MNRTDRIIYGSLLLLLSFLTGCSGELPIEQPAAAADGTAVRLSVTIGAEGRMATRAGGTPLLNDLRLLVFDEEHHFLYSRKAILQSTKEDGIADSNHLPDEQRGAITQMMDFSVEMITSTKERYIHFVSGYDWTGFPQDYFLQGKDEGEIIPTLESSNGKVVYWQRVKISSLDERTFQGKVIKLLRNMAQIQIVPPSGNARFEISGIKICNTYDRGTVAPFIFNEAGLSYDFPGLPNNPTIPANYSESTPQEYSAQKEFDIYERLASDKKSGKNLYILLKAKYDGQECYYKLDLVIPDRQKANIPEFTDIIRNHLYKIKIEQVLSKGFSTEAEAISSPAANNLFSSLELSDYRHISDGTNSLTALPLGDVVVSPGTFQSDITFSNGAQNVKIYPNWEDNDEYVGPAQYLPTSGNQGKLTVEVKKVPTDRTITRTLYVVGTNGDGSVITRTVRIIIRRPYKFNAKIGSGRGDFTISFDIPSDLPDMVYPFDIQVFANYLTPDQRFNRLLIRNNSKDYFFVYKVEDRNTVSQKITLYFKSNSYTSESQQITLQSKYFETVNIPYKYNWNR